MQVEVGEHKWSIDKVLAHKLKLIAKSRLRRNRDFVLLVDGVPGIGKSTFAAQIAKIVDPSFDVHNMHYDGDDFIKAAVDSPKYKAIIYDEAYRDWSNLRVLSSISHRLNAMLMEIRQNNLFIIIILPSWFDLNKTMAIFRSDAMIHCYERPNGARAFNYYTREAKKYMYIRGKKFYNYKYGNPIIKSTFSDYMPINMEGYLKKKKAMMERLKQEQIKPLGKLDKKRELARNGLAYLLKHEFGHKYSDAARRLSNYTNLKFSTNELSNWGQEFEKKYLNRPV